MLSFISLSYARSDEMWIDGVEYNQRGVMTGDKREDM
jgi:hypothetical protein